MKLNFHFHRDLGFLVYCEKLVRSTLLKNQSTPFSVHFIKQTTQFTFNFRSMFVCSSAKEENITKQDYRITMIKFNKISEINFKTCATISQFSVYQVQRPRTYRQSFYPTSFNKPPYQIKVESFARKFNN